MMRNKVMEIWPEIEWIKNDDLKEKVYLAWEYALENSVLTVEDLLTIPFTLLCETTVTFMEHKRSVVHIAVDSAKAMTKFYGDRLPIDMDLLIAGAIMIDIGKLVEYVLDENGKAIVGKTGKLLRHPFTGVGISMRFDLPDEVGHMIATHSKEGDLGKRTVESIIVHHADFASFEPFMKSLKY